MKLCFVKADQFDILQPCYVVEDGVVLGFHYPLARIDTTTRSAVVDFRNDEYAILVLRGSMEPVHDNVRMQRLVAKWFGKFGEERESDSEAFTDLDGLKDRAKAYGRLP